MDFSEGLATLERRAKVARIMLWTFVAASALTAVCEALEASGTIDIEADMGLLTMVAALSYMAYTIIFIICVVVVARWIHRAHANLHEAGVDSLEFTPGWAVGWYFIPFANLIKPFQAMRELWNVSRGAEHQFTGDTPPEIKAWWAAWIIGNIVSSIGSQILSRGEGGPGSLTVGNAVGAAGTLTMLFAALLLVKVIDSITRFQRGGSTAAGVFA